MKARSQAKPKRFRRYDSTGLSGTLEALPRPRVRHHLVGGKWITLAVVALLVVGAILWIWLSDTFYVTRISVAGNALTPAPEIVQIRGIGGQHMLWVNHAAASERIANGIPSVKSARVDCQLPNRCAIKVQERQPSVAWRFGGAVTWIADDGMAFAAHRDTNLPLITIEARNGRVSELAELDRLVREAYRDPGLRNLVYSATSRMLPVRVYEWVRAAARKRAGR